MLDITDRKSASHAPFWAFKHSENQTAHQQRGLRLKSIFTSQPPSINVKHCSEVMDAILFSSSLLWRLWWIRIGI